MTVRHLLQAVQPDDHSCGPVAALVTLVEYADFECRHCVEAFPIVRELSARFAPCLRVVFRHSPRSYDHPRAALAAEAVEAAAEQGKFWSMHDYLFQHQGVLEVRDLLTYARRLGLDEERFAESLRVRSNRSRVRRDQVAGVRSRVGSSPAFFINGTRFSGGVNREALAAAISEARSDATCSLTEQRCATSFDALGRLLALTTALRDTYKLHYWHGLTLPLARLRMVLGSHTREQTALIERISRRMFAVRPVSVLLAAREIGPWGPTTNCGDAERVEQRLMRLLEAHQFVVMRSHCLANRLSELRDAESTELVTRDIIATNERQAATITERVFTERLASDLH